VTDLIILLLQDAYLLNKPIEHYKEMMVIFGNGQAIGKWAMGSNEALGAPSNCAESSLKTEATEILNSGKTDTCDTTKAEIIVGSKRKRSLLGENMRLSSVACLRQSRRWPLLLGPPRLRTATLISMAKSCSS
jgi:hypothetical protein